jgi:hypothetical protein
VSGLIGETKVNNGWIVESESYQILKLFQRRGVHPLVGGTRKKVAMPSQIINGLKAVMKTVRR